MSPALPVLTMTPPSLAVCLVTEGDVTELQVDAPTLLRLAHDVLVSGLRNRVSLWLSTSLLLNASVCGLRDEGDAVGLGHCLLQAVDRVAAAVDDRGGSHGGGYRVDLGGGHVLHAGVGHGAVGVGDEGLGLNRIAEQVENPIDNVCHFFVPFEWCVAFLEACRRAVRRTGDNVMDPATLEKRGRNPSLRERIPG